ncbi:MAG: lytic transglycosylase domain-containing protein [Pseudomonadota bacterium]
MSVRIGKAALFHGIPLVDYAYPTHAFPLFKPIVPPPEPAMLYGLARQESEFNTLIKSIAGARGVLQVMPPTARDVCRTHNLRCGSRRALTRRLSADPSYNAALASAYLTGRLEEFTGSYILTYAGYNAGPGRARYWIRKSGDPRNRNVDPIDWIELIHIKETREYVKKVMANLQIYRARLGAHETALQISKDIERGSF